MPLLDVGDPKGGGDETGFVAELRGKNSLRKIPPPLEENSLYATSFTTIIGS